MGRLNTFLRFHKTGLLNSQTFKSRSIHLNKELINGVKQNPCGQLTKFEPQNIHESANHI